MVSALRNFANRTVVAGLVTPPLPFDTQPRPTRVLARQNAGQQGAGLAFSVALTPTATILTGIRAPAAAAS